MIREDVKELNHVQGVLLAFAVGLQTFKEVPWLYQYLSYSPKPIS